MSKRGAGGGIKAAFARQAQRAEVAAQTATWPGLEAPSSAAQQVPEEYLQQLASKFEAYINKRDAIVKLAAKSSRASLLPLRADADAAGPADQQTEVAKWQGNAAFCIQQLSMWPGSGVALQLQQQEVLLHIMINCDLHLDPLLSTKAYSLLLRNLAKHPPVQLGSSSGSSQGGSQPSPPVLLCATNAGVCWQLFEHQSQPLLPDAPTPFPLLQQLVQNAVLLVVGGGPRSSAGQRSSSSSKAASQGQALLLLYVVQLLQADLLVRQVAFERYMQLSKTAQGEGQKEEALSRAGTALQHSLLHRVMQDDSIGGDAWRFIPDSSKGKHQLVRDLLLLACSTGDGRDQAAPAKGAARAAATPLPTAAAAAAAGEDTLMVDADADAGAAATAAAAAEPAASQAAAAAAAAAAAGYADAGVVPQQAPVVSAQELIQSARLLLLLLLQLYSSCEEAGLYGRGGEGRHHMQRQGGGGQPNDRFELDDVMMTAIGFCGHSAASFTLPQLAQHSNLQRLLAALPPVHRVRLLCLMVASVIHNRVVDPESEGKLALAPYNMELQGLEGYLHGKGRGHAGFRQPSAVFILQAVDARLEWAAKEMFGGKVLFPLLMATLVSAASVTLRDAPDLDKQTFCQAANRVLDHVLLQGRDAFAVAAHMGRCEALAALAVAKQHLQSLC